MSSKMIVALFTVVLSLSSQASGLYCGVSSYGTPSETARHGAHPYRTAQIDSMTATSIQIDIHDEYGNGSDNEVVMVELMDKATGSIAGILTGQYSKELKILHKEGKVQLVYKNWTYNCDVL